MSLETPLDSAENRADLSGTYLGIDVGNSRVGVAVSDPHGKSAFPLVTLQHASDYPEIQEVLDLVQGRQAKGIYIGLPLTMRGTESDSTRMAKTWAERCVQALTAAKMRCAVSMVDERLTSASARSALHSAGVSSRDFKAGVDQIAASHILQHALDMQNNLGRIVGVLLRAEESDE